MNAVSIFNLNSFTWTDEFDPSAVYESPEKVKTWNSEHESPLRGWNSGVQELFAGLNVTSTNSTNTNSTGSPNPSVTSSPAAGSSSNNLPKLLGGILGGLAVIILILGGILFLIKRKKRAAGDRYELAAEPPRPAEMPGNQPMAELAGMGEYAVYTPPVDVKDKRVT